MAWSPFDLAKYPIEKFLRTTVNIWKKCDWWQLLWRFQHQELFLPRNVSEPVEPVKIIRMFIKRFLVMVMLAMSIGHTHGRYTHGQFGSVKSRGEYLKLPLSIGFFLKLTIGFQFHWHFLLMAVIVINLKPKSLLIFCCKQPAVVLQYSNKPQSEQNIGVVKIQMDCFFYLMPADR